MKWRRFWKALSIFFSEHALSLFTAHANLKGYGPRRFSRDMRAAFNVAMVAFPQGMAYAAIAGLPVQYGVFASVSAAIIAPLMASSPITMIGPTNATAVMMGSIFATLPPGMERIAVAGLLVLMTGAFLLIGAQLKLASMLTFVSRTVMIGYISAAALLIVTNQVHHMTGTVLDGKPGTFFDAARLTIASLPSLNLYAVEVAALTFLLLYAVNRWIPMLPAAAVALVVVSLFTSLTGTPLPHVDAIPAGGLPWTPPQFSFYWFQQLAAPAIALAFLCSLESVVMAKSLASRTGTSVNANQEAFSVGAGNVACAFTGGMVASGSLTRSALNAETGASSPLASIASGLICLAIAALLGPFVDRIPQAALAAVVIAIAVSLFNLKAIRVTLKSTRSDAIVLFSTFSAALLLPLDQAIFIGVAVSIILFLRKASAPQLAEYTFNEEGNLSELEGQRTMPTISIIHVEGELFFGAVDLFREEVRRIAMDSNLKIVILRMRNARHLDATSVFAIEDLLKYLGDTGRHLLVSGVSRDVYRVLRNSGLLLTLGKENIFLASPQNPNLATRNALKRAQELLGGEQADVRIFFDPAKKLAKEQKS